MPGWWSQVERSSIAGLDLRLRGAASENGGLHMPKLVIMAALGCLAMATAADAQIAGSGRSPCAYGATDKDLVIEIASFDLRSPALA
jgi:hypothetical protein